MGYGGITLQDCVIIDELNEALCMQFKGDNRGPPNVTEVEETYANLTKTFPNAEIIGL